jgi:Asp-tRNA(Asn)/Glu-tRNA(Gln) amidotransferase A subunit family amidase
MVVELLKAAGGIPICKTNCPWHLLFTSVTNPLIGKTVNDKNELISLGGRCGALAVLVSLSIKSLIQVSYLWG